MNFYIRQHLAKLQAKKLIISRALRALALSCWMIKNSPDILSMARNSCCYLLLHWFWLGLDNYQTGVDWQTCQLTSSETIRLGDTPSGLTSERLWLNVDDVWKDFAAKSLSLLRQLRTVNYSVRCWVNIFSSANYIMLTLLDKYFQWLNLAWQFQSCAAVCSEFLSRQFLEDIFHKVR